VIGTALEDLFGLLINGNDSWVFLKPFRIMLLFAPGSLAPTSTPAPLPGALGGVLILWLFKLAAEQMLRDAEPSFGQIEGLGRILGFVD